MAGSGFGPVVIIENEAQTRRLFKTLGGAGKDLSKANRKVAKVAETGSRAHTSTAQQSSAKAALSARATQSAAQLAIRATGSVPYGVGAFMGAKRWHQFPPWVGATWDLTKGEGPYAIRDYFSGSGLEDVKDAYVKNISDTLASAGLEMT